MRDGGCRTLRAIELPLVLQPGWVEAETRQRGEIGRNKRSRERLQHGWAREQALRTVAKPADNKIAVLERRKPDPDRRVESFADHVDPTIGAFQPHLDPARAA